MRPETQHILEKRRLRRRVALWRALTLVAIVAIVAILVPRGTTKPQPYVARVAIEGVILEDRDRDRFLLGLAEDDTVRAVVLHISSPGGSVVGSEALYGALRTIALEKPVVAVMGDLAASGGYIAAIASEHIIARGGTLTGSIGVISSVPNIEGLLDMAGIEVRYIRSSPLKGEPTISGPLSPESLAAQEELLAEAYDWFRNLVAERRALDGARLDAVADGRAFHGWSAVDLGLIDAIGDERTARAWLAETHDISADLEIRDRDWRSGDLPWPLSDLERARAALFGDGVTLPPAPRLWAVIQ